MTILRIALPKNEHDALRTMAKREYRDPRSQAALLIRQELERRGLLPDTAAPINSQQGARHEKR